MQLNIIWYDNIRESLCKDGKYQVKYLGDDDNNWSIIVESIWNCFGKKKIYRTWSLNCLLLCMFTKLQKHNKIKL